MERAGTKGHLSWRGAGPASPTDGLGELAWRLVSRAVPRALTICPTVVGQMPGAKNKTQLLDPQSYQTPLFWCARFPLLLCPWLYNLPLLLERKGRGGRELASTAYLSEPGSVVDASRFWLVFILFAFSNLHFTSEKTEEEWGQATSSILHNQWMIGPRYYSG